MGVDLNPPNVEPKQTAHLQYIYTHTHSTALSKQNAPLSLEVLHKDTFTATGSLRTDQVVLSMLFAI